MKLFVISDPHSFYTIMINALDEAGFEKDNPNHLLIVCGDIFDRGYESQEILDYFNNLNNKIIIRGNHEDLLMECIERGYPLSHDYHNGTVMTILDLGNKNNFLDCCKVTESKIKPLFDNMVNYFETRNYIFCHSTLPLSVQWRSAAEADWQDARWGNPFEFWREYTISNDKTVVFGHWNTSYFNTPKNQFDDKSNFDIAYGYDYGFIGIDACTAYSKKINVLVIEDELE